MKMRQSLQSLLVQGQSLYEQAASGAADEETLIEAVRILEGLQARIASEAVFSINEELDDVDTDDLPLLATDAYFGLALLRLPFRGPAARLALLDRAEAVFSRYLDLCESMGLLGPQDAVAWRQAARGGGDDSSGGGGGGGGSSASDPARTRAMKIERYKRQQTAQQRMAQLRSELAVSEAAAASAGGRAGGHDGDSTRRELNTLLLSTLASEALDEIGSIHAETPMLRQMAEATTASGGGGSGSGGGEPVQGRRGPPEPGSAGPGLKVTHVSSENGRLRLQEEEIRAQIFRPTVAPPTMTLEEYADIELQRAKEREVRVSDREREAPKADRRADQLAADGEEDDEALADRATVRDRAWDDWKDENPRGIGNKANKRI
ncbi:unnamed protein product [Phaeothamnion confervicola]